MSRGGFALDRIDVGDSEEGGGFCASEIRRARAADAQPPRPRALPRRSKGKRGRR